MPVLIPNRRTAAGAEPMARTFGDARSCAADGCTIRLSRMLNYSGVAIPKNPQGMRTTTGADHRNYAFAMLEMRGWLTDHFGAPAIDRTGPPVSRDAFRGIKGIIAFDIHFTDAVARRRHERHPRELRAAP